MTNNLPATVNTGSAVVDLTAATSARDYVTMMIADQMFGIPVLEVQDVLGPQRITRIPLAPAEIAGALNLRGRIVTAIDVRIKMGLPVRGKGETSMSVVVEHHNELYSLMVDSVGEVLSLGNEKFERNPATIDAQWRDLCSGVYRLEQQLLVILDISRLLNLSHEQAA
jgi:purine-binding chemotaxis protein CheW